MQELDFEFWFLCYLHYRHTDWYVLFSFLLCLDGYISRLPGRINVGKYTRLFCQPARSLSLTDALAIPHRLASSKMRTEMRRGLSWLRACPKREFQ